MTQVPEDTTASAVSDAVPGDEEEDAASSAEEGEEGNSKE